MGSIALIGPMGSGKSSVARLLGKSLQYKLVDLDSTIQDSTGETIMSIFEVHGEAYFRALEAQCLLDVLSEDEPIVLATGGGVVLAEESRAYLRQHTTVFYLSGSVDVLLARLQHDTKRPLLKTDDPREAMERILYEREALYSACAHYTIPIDDLSVQQVAQVIESILLKRSMN